MIKEGDLHQGTQLYHPVRDHRVRLRRLQIAGRMAVYHDDIRRIGKDACLKELPRMRECLVHGAHACKMDIDRCPVRTEVYDAHDFTVKIAQVAPERLHNLVFRAEGRDHGFHPRMVIAHKSRGQRRIQLLVDVVLLAHVVGGLPGLPCHFLLVLHGSLEGFLFPDTYFFTEGMAVDSIIETLVDNFFAKIGDIPSLKGLSPEKLKERVILASIVEREYQVADEAPLIASVFQNRIDGGIGLYSCATIEYILTEIEGRPHPDRISYDDLKIDSPYNTYKWAALPPTPISNPGLIALRAVADPPETDYYYFVLTDPSTGSHTFSKDFKGHVKAESLYTKPAKK